MTEILLFGARGQLGRELAALADERGVIIAPTAGAGPDVTDPGAVARAIEVHRPAVVVNCAAFTRVDDAETNAEEAFRINEVGAAIVARSCAEAGIPLIHISTDYVFDGTKEGPYREDDPIAPLNVYGRSKAAGDAAVRAAWERHLILRTSWLYGAFGSNFLKTVLRLAGECDALHVVADQRGCPTAALDLAQAILIAARRLASAEPVAGTYHFAGTGVTTWHGFATEIIAAQAALTGRQPIVHAVSHASRPTPARRPANSELDSSLFASTFGFRAKDWRVRTREVLRLLVT